MDHICQVTEYLFSVLLRGHRIELGRTPVCTVLLMEGIVLMSLVDTPNRKGNEVLGQAETAFDSLLKEVRSIECQRNQQLVKSTTRHEY